MKNKYGKKLESVELEIIGCTPDAIKWNYSGSDSEYFFNEETGEVAELIHGTELVTIFKNVDEFVEIFNVIEPISEE